MSTFCATFTITLVISDASLCKLLLSSSFAISAKLATMVFLLVVCGVAPRLQRLFLFVICGVMPRMRRLFFVIRGVTPGAKIVFSFHPWSGAPDAKIVLFSSVGGLPEYKDCFMILSSYVEWRQGCKDSFYFLSV